MTLPKGVVGPFFNDEFGDVFGIVYGITYDGFTPREARDFAETARASSAAPRTSARSRSSAIRTRRCT